MSTKTTFKRIALVAVASMGLGLLSTVPAKATVQSLDVVVSNGTATVPNATNGAFYDSSTGATVTVTGLLDNATDSMTISYFVKSQPGTTVNSGHLRLVETATSTSAVIESATADNTSATANTTTAIAYNRTVGMIQILDSVSADNKAAGPAAALRMALLNANTNTATGYATWKFRIDLDSNTSINSGNYVYTVVVKAFNTATNSANAGGGVPVQTITKDVTIVASNSTASSTVASSAYSTAVMSLGTADKGASVDSLVSIPAYNNDNADSAVINLVLKNASNKNAAESVTATITGAGKIGNGSIYGRSVTLAYSSNPLLIGIRGDGTVGTATITISTTSVTFATKNVTFYATGVATITPTLRLNALAVGANSAAITGVVLDSSGNQNYSSSAMYAFSSNTAVVSNDGTACSFSNDNVRQECSLTGVAAGTATITFRNASTAAAATYTSPTTVTVTVRSTPPATLKMELNKPSASYAPGEKGYLKVWAVDSAGNVVSPGTYTLLAGGISTSAQLGSNSDIPVASTTTSIALAQTSAATGLESKDPIKLYTFYAPVSGGSFTFTAVGGAALPVANQVAVTVTGKVTDSGSEALAAVTALASQVSAFITKINAQITTLTDLVMKIQKKVKA